MVSIIILTYNNLTLNRQCLESIFERTQGVEFEVVVVDNASADETPEFLQDFAASRSNVRLILNETNLGFSAGNNQGAAAANGDTLVFLNNDTVVTEGWLQGLLQVLEDQTVGMVGPVTNEIGNESCIPVDYSNLDTMPDFARRYTQEHTGQRFEIDVLAFFCVAIRREVFEEVGPLDEQFGVGMFEDDDYAMRLKQRGYKLICTEDVFVHHIGSAGFSAMDIPRYWKLFDTNRQKFETKWGVEWQPHLKRPELLRKQVRQMVDSTSWHVSMIADLRQQKELLEQQLDARQKLLLATEAALDQANVQVRALTDIYASRSWKLILFLRRIRLALAPEGSRREKSLLNLFRLPRRITQALTPPHISWYAYVFERYKRNRKAVCSDDLSAIHCSTQPGLVSIVLPVYNGEAYISEAIESILNQTSPSFELIVVDDGSTDATARILDEFAARDARIRVITQENQRLPRALSNGFQAARGEFLTWTSADNRLKPDFIERMVDCLHRHPDWEFIYTNQDIIDEDGAPLINSKWFYHYQQPPGSEHIMLPTEPLELNVYPNNYIGGAFMYRDRVQVLAGGYSEWRYGIEDYDYWMRINALLTLRHADFNNTIYEYRFHSSSLTSQDKELGITRHRVRLMVFDDFRRDFYLTPLVWRIEAAGGAESIELANQVRQQASGAGHLFYEQVIPNPEKLPAYWLPVVHVRFSNQTNSAPVIASGRGVGCNQPQAISPPAPVIASGLREAISSSGIEASPAPVIASDLCEAISPPGFEASAGPILVTPPSFDHPEITVIPDPNSQFLVQNSDPRTLFTALDILARRRALEQIEALVENPPAPAYKASVVICTYRRGAALAESLRSVAQQSFPPADFEIIVVNNDPFDEPVEAVIANLRQEFFANNPEHIKHIHCPLKGLSFARNAGISEASGEIVCFLDDDARAKPDWLEQVWRSFEENPQAGVVGGLIRLDIPQPRPSALKPGWERYWSQFLPGYEEPVLVTNWWEFPWGANWSARRKALLQIGGFRSRYGRRGSDFGGGEELVAAALIQHLGYQIVVNPRSEVIHRPDHSRFTWKHVWRTIRSGKFAEYQERIDLYLPMELSLRYFMHSQISNIKTVLRPKSAYYQRLEAAYFGWLDFRLTFRLLGDRLRRIRKSAQGSTHTP